MKVFVTGANGYIGTAVVRRYRLAGHAVLALARSDASAAKLAEAGCEVLRGDVNDHASLLKGMAVSQAAAHLAAVQGNQGAAEMDIAAVKVMSEAVRGTGKRFILTTSMGVYSQAKGLVDEDTPLAPAPAQMWRQELEALVSGSAPAVNGVTVRPSLVYGRGSASRVLLSQLDAIRKAGTAAYAGEGTGLSSFVHLDDIADLYLIALEKAAPGQGLNAVGQQVPARDLARALASAAGTKTPPRSIPPESAQGEGARTTVAGGSSFVSGIATARLGWRPQGPGILHELLHGTLSGSRRT